MNAPRGLLYSPLDISVIGWTTFSPFARLHRNTSMLRDGSSRPGPLNLLRRRDQGAQPVVRLRHGMAEEADVAGVAGDAPAVLDDAGAAALHSAGELGGAVVTMDAPAQVVAGVPGRLRWPGGRRDRGSAR